MWSRVVICAAAGLVAGASYADTGCNATAQQQYRDCVRIVDSLRPDKAGQARVFAADGSEFTTGQALWMRRQVSKVQRLCASGAAGDQAEAARVLAEVQKLLKTHHLES